MEPTSVLAVYALLAAALQKSDGHDHPVAITLVIAAFLLVVWSVLGREARPKVPIARLAWWVALGSALLGFARKPALYIPADVSLAPYRVLLAAGVVVIVVGATGRLVRLRAPLLALVFVLAGLWTLHASPAPGIDVFVIHQQGADLLLHGKSMYVPGAVQAIDTKSFARVIGEYAYPPLSAILTTLGYAIAHDSRHAQLLAMLAGAFVLRRTARDRELGDALFACMLFHPRALFVLEEAWGEPLVFPFLAGFALAMLVGRVRLAAVLLGLGVALKQHLVLYLPALMFVPGFGLRGGVLAGAVAVATYLPFVLFARDGMWQSLVMHHVNNPFRGDSLSVSALLSNAHVMLPKWLAPLSTVGSFAILPRVRRAVAPLLAASTIAFFCFYLFGRQAFANYYWLIGATLLLAIATLRDEPGR